MKLRFLRLSRAALVVVFLATACYCAQGQGPGGPSHGGPPLGAPGPGGGPGNGPGSGSPGSAPHSTPGAHGVAGASHSSQQFGPIGRWWDDKSVIKSVGISKTQQKTMDAVFDANKPAILESYKSFLSAQAALDKVNKDPKSDQATIFAAIDAVSSARASLQKATAQMLLQIRQQMDADQIAKLEKLQ